MKRVLGLLYLGLGALAGPRPARAALVMSPLVVDLTPGQPPRSDVEMFNSGSEKLYIVVEPARVDDAGLPTEHRVSSPDPEQLGLIATPSRAILEPGQRKFLRLAALRPPGAADRVFRVTVKPVVGGVTGAVTGLKVLVGYDMLLIQRPSEPRGKVTGERKDRTLLLRNAGNTNAELFHGRQCDPSGASCADLPSGRLYAGAALSVPVTPAWRVVYDVKVMDRVAQQSF